MAFGLRAIANKTYTPHGNGRDFFFLGDYQYRNGRKTPDVNERWKSHIDKPPAQRRGPPREMAAAYYAARRKPQSGSSSVEPLRLPVCSDPDLLGPQFHVARWKASGTEPRRSAEAEDQMPNSRGSFLGDDTLKTPLWRMQQATGTLSKSLQSSLSLPDERFRTTTSDIGSHQGFRASGPKYAHMDSGHPLFPPVRAS
eukprot:TRINITY_DN73384_c0_g1_i1.p1 TRINITY_DN73384_c0_g1~~TRINITY_DN73384_c0_g1_i1.p1  ORF type:complete len:198 (+),score=24.73 TRINITY_DN73384_c0_g1_i1:59-652(+)